MKRIIRHSGPSKLSEGRFSSPVSAEAENRFSSPAATVDIRKKLRDDIPTAEPGSFARKTLVLAGDETGDPPRRL